jgi:MFS family permease
MTVRLGLRENAPQFALLVALNALVGAMVGLERSVLPLVGEDDFGLTSTSAILAFVVAFGMAKALANLVAGGLADRFGRRRLLILGWILALPVPLLIGVAPVWGFVVVANLFLGASQGFAWSMTVVMKIDLVGPKRRGLALAFNESAGYLGVALAALASGALAATYAPRTVVWVGGLVVATLGLAISALFVRDTSAHVSAEQRSHGGTPARSLKAAFARGTAREPVLRACSQAGLVNNLNAALAWGLAPLYLAANGATIAEVGVVAAVYPGVGGAGHGSAAGCRITSAESRSSRRGCLCRLARSVFSSPVEEPSHRLSSPLRSWASGQRSCTPLSSQPYRTQCSHRPGSCRRRLPLLARHRLRRGRPDKWSGRRRVRSRRGNRGRCSADGRKWALGGRDVVDAVRSASTFPRQGVRWAERRSMSSSPKHALGSSASSRRRRSPRSARVHY